MCLSLWHPSQPAQRRYLLFASIGDQSDDYLAWCSPNRAFDLYLVYYGKTDGKAHEACADRCAVLYNDEPVLRVC